MEPGIVKTKGGSIEVSSNYLDEHIYAESLAAYRSQTKADPTGRDTIKPEQLEQMLLGRGTISNLQPEIFERTSPIRAQGESETRAGVHGYYAFDPETVAAARSVIEKRGSLHEAEYFNRKLRLSGYNADFDGNELNGPEPTEPERKVPRFIFEPDTILYQEIEKVNVRLRLPYKECMFVQEMWTRSALETPNPDTFNVFAIELSDTKFFFMFDLHGIPFSVQVNQFRSKLSTEQVQYKAWLAEGPDKRLDAKDEKHKLADTAFRSVAPIIAFLEGMSQGIYTLEREGVQVPPSQVAPEAKEGVEYKVRSLRPNQPVRVSVPLGGTHASPREHERQGHWRRNCHGVKKWITGLTVNKGKTKGKVIKDYKIMDPTK